jgi:hypothetical protein
MVTVTFPLPSGAPTVNGLAAPSSADAVAADIKRTDTFMRMLLLFERADILA